MRFRLLGLLILTTSTSWSQSVNVPLNKLRYNMLDRVDVMGADTGAYFFTTVKPYGRQEVVDRYKKQNDAWLLENGEFFLNDSWEKSDDQNQGISSRKPFLKHFYKRKADALHIVNDDLEFHMSPVLHWSYGTETSRDINTFVNVRGVEVRGLIDDKVGFYSFIAENQAIFPEYVSTYIFAKSYIPYENFWKTFKENGVDFFTARGYISFNATEHINIQAGHDRQFIGNGYRSLVLSDFAGNYGFVKLNTQVGRFHYTNLYTKMTADVSPNPNGGLLGSQLFPEKYMTLHHLEIALRRNLTIGFFESIIFNRWDDSSGTGGGYDINYLNPIIFYRAIEQNLGSQDNALIGMDFKWNLWNRISLYGQLTLDEFKLSEYRDNNGWWANKYGLQLGGKYFNAFGVKGLDLQGETNVVRPYTYSHDELYNSYTHYRQPLAHPLGANFTEVLGIARYQAGKKLFLTGKLFLINQGLDSDSTNFGGNIFLTNDTREMEYGNEIGQGIQVKTMYASLTVSYELRHNVFLDFEEIIRKTSSDVAAFQTQTAQTVLSLRWNIPQRLHEF